MRLCRTLLWVTVLALGACDGEPPPAASNEKIREHGGQTLRTATVLSPAQKETVGNSVERKLQDLFMQIRILKTEAAARGGGFDQELRATVEAVENKANGLRDRIGKLGAGAAEQWKAMLEEIDGAMEQLEEVSEEVVTQFSA